MFYLIQLNENTIITNKLASFAEYLKIYDNEINFIKIFDKEETYNKELFNGAQIKITKSI